MTTCSTNTPRRKNSSSCHDFFRLIVNTNLKAHQPFTRLFSHEKHSHSYVQVFSYFLHLQYFDKHLLDEHRHLEAASSTPWN
jgi:hypothetical protein